jgi:hypothetical protein
MRKIRILIVTLLCLPLTACFEEPVREHLHLTIRTDGSVVATVVQRVAPNDRGRNNPQLADRLEETRANLEQQLDPWSQRFAKLTPLAEHVSLESSDGEVRRAIRSAVLESFDEVLRLVEADGLTGNLIDTGHAMELNLFPTGGSRATYSQRNEIEHRLRRWSSDLADYLGSVIDLYGHLEREPERAVSCLAHIFDTHEGLGETGPLSPVEEEIVLRVKETMERVADALLVPDNEAFSLNELSRLVYDPFPARLTVRVGADVLHVSGFVARSGFFERPAVDVWNALKALEGRWISPDLVTAAAAPVPDDQQPEPDVLLLASRARRYASAPTSGDVESAILAELIPEDLLQLRWRQSGEQQEEIDIGSEKWLDAMAAAEANVPD